MKIFTNIIDKDTHIIFVPYAILSGIYSSEYIFYFFVDTFSTFLLYSHKLISFTLCIDAFWNFYSNKQISLLVHISLPSILSNIDSMIP